MATKKNEERVPVEPISEMPKSTEVATIAEGSTELGLTNEDIAQMLMDDSGNQFSREDIALPFLRILQKGSPQVNKRDPAYIEGAEEGMIINTVTGELFNGEDGFIGIPVFYTPSYTQWAPERKGFRADHGANASILTTCHKNEKGEDELPSGDIINRSGFYYLYLFREATGIVEQAAIAMSGSGLRVSRKWNTTIAGITVSKIPGNPKSGFINPAMFYMSYHIRAKYESNDKGTWFNWDVTPHKPTLELKPTGTQIYLAAREFRKMVEAGEIKAKAEQGAESHASEGSAAF